MDEAPAILAGRHSRSGIAPAIRQQWQQWQTQQEQQRRQREGNPKRRRVLQLLGIAALWPAQAFAADRLATAPGTPDSGATTKEVLVVGDSLSAEYGLGRGEGWVSLLQERTEPKGWRVANASISGETTAGGLSRLPALLRKNQPAVTVIELGANDALRGLSLAATDANLRKMVQLARQAGSKPLLVGMMLPPNFGPAYARQFSGMFRRIAESEKIALVPFLLDGFADDLAWFQSDRIHPTAKAQPRMLDNVWPVLSEML